MGVPMVVGSAVRRHFTSVARLVETWAGVEIRARRH